VLSKPGRAAKVRKKPAEEKTWSKRGGWKENWGKNLEKTFLSSGALPQQAKKNLSWKRSWMPVLLKVTGKDGKGSPRKMPVKKRFHQWVYPPTRWSRGESRVQVVHVRALRWQSGCDRQNETADADHLNEVEMSAIFKLRKSVIKKILRKSIMLF